MSLDLDTPYQITKMLGELCCNFYGNFYGVSAVRARASSTRSVPARSPAATAT